MSEVTILLGGNQGDKHKIFSETIKLIGETIGKIEALSSVYETEPWGFVSDLFWNQAMVLSTTLLPEEVLTHAQDIENKMGRKRLSDKYEARPIDIDLMFYDDLQINTPRLIIPHPLDRAKTFYAGPAVRNYSRKNPPRHRTDY